MKFVLLFFYCFAFSLIAEDLITKNGKTYKNYSIEEIKSKYVLIYYDGGMAKISYKNLTDEWKKKHNITPDKIKKLREKEIKQKKQDLIDQKKYQRKQYEKKLHKITQIISWDIWVYEILSSSALIAKVGIKYPKYIIIENYPNAKNLIDKQTIPGNYKHKHSYLTQVGRFKFKTVSTVVNGFKLYYIGPKKILGSTYPCFTLNKDRAIEYIIKNPKADLTPVKGYF